MKKKAQPTTNDNTVTARVRLGNLEGPARIAARARHRGDISAYIADLIRRDLKHD